MISCIVLDLLCNIGFLTLISTRALQLSREFKRYPSPAVGPVRLASGWHDESLTFCVHHCMTRYPDTCQSAMYNHVTHFCTPGQWLDPAQPVPNVEEGDLYSTNPCDISNGFELYTFGTTRVCLFNSISSQQTYFEATDVCQSKNSSLYTVKTLDKLALLQNIHEQKILFVGLDDIQTEGRYIWSDDGSELEPSLTPDLFNNGEPNNQDNLEDCCVIWNKNGRYKLNDFQCSLRTGFFCEKQCYF